MNWEVRGQWPYIPSRGRIKQPAPRALSVLSTGLLGIITPRELFSEGEKGMCPKENRKEKREEKNGRNLRKDHINIVQSSMSWYKPVIPAGER